MKVSLCEIGRASERALGTEDLPLLCSGADKTERAHHLLIAVTEVLYRFIPKAEERDGNRQSERNDSRRFPIIALWKPLVVPSSKRWVARCGQ
jgi:hypothetical protein